MIFELDEYTSRKYVMHCDTFEKAQIFLQYLHNHGMTWQDGSSYMENMFWSFNKNTCYRFNEGIQASINYYLQMPDVSILEFDHFDWSFTEETTIDSEAFNEMLEVM